MMEYGNCADARIGFYVKRDREPMKGFQIFTRIACYVFSEQLDDGKIYVTVRDKVTDKPVSVYGSPGSAVRFGQMITYIQENHEALCQLYDRDDDTCCVCVDGLLAKETDDEVGIMVCVVGGGFSVLPPD